MKKIAFLTVIIAGITATSCSKDHVCSCTYDDPISGQTTVDADLTDMNKSEAEDGCNLLAASYQVIDPNADCELK